MDEAELQYFQSTFYDDYLGEEEELMNDVMVKSGLVEFDSESEDDLFDVENATPKKLPTLDKPTELLKEVTIKQEPLSEEDENEPGTSEETISPKSVQPESTNIIKCDDTNEDFAVEVITKSAPLTNPKTPQNTPISTSVIIKNEPLLDIKVENIEVPKEIVKKIRRQSIEKCQIKEEMIDLDGVVVKQEPPDDTYHKSEITISSSNDQFKSSTHNTEDLSISIYPVTSCETNVDKIYGAPSNNNETGNSSQSDEISNSSLNIDKIYDTSNDQKKTDRSSNENRLRNLSDNSFFSSKLLRKRLEQPQKESEVEKMDIETIDNLSRAFHIPEGFNTERAFSNFHFKIKSINIEGLKTNFICLKCNETIQDYKSVLSHPCYDSINVLPSLECFYCRRFIVSNVDYIMTHFSGVFNFFLLNNHISVYKCCYKNCLFITPSSTCFSLHLKLTHCQPQYEKKESRKAETKKTDQKKVEFKKKTLPLHPLPHQIEFGHDLYNCGLCQNKFQTEFALKKHVASKHTNSIRKDYKFGCNYCNFRAVFMSSLKVHLNFAHKKYINIARPTETGLRMPQEEEKYREEGSKTEALGLPVVTASCSSTCCYRDSR